ncbi:hypothetical protein FACS189443_2620 [Planctomycetales bacterium]|nr:hypothetical protein FACS189443_2620 [Planctomycetales bacterium]
MDDGEWFQDISGVADFGFGVWLVGFERTENVSVRRLRRGGGRLEVDEVTGNDNDVGDRSADRSVLEHDTIELI